MNTKQIKNEIQNTKTEIFQIKIHINSYYSSLNANNIYNLNNKRIELKKDIMRLNLKKEKAEKLDILRAIRKEKLKQLNDN